MSSRNKPKVAVIGSGLAGLTCAYLLVKEGWEVFLIEKSEKLGFHSSSVDIPLSARLDGEKGKAASGDQRWVVDVPMRSFQGGYYPQLIALYKHLSIPLKPTHFTFSFSHLHSANQDSKEESSRHSTYFLYNGASGVSIPHLSTQYLKSPYDVVRGVLTFGYMATCYIILLFVAFLSWHGFLPGLLGSPTATLNILVEYLRPIPYGWFVRDVIVPIFSSVGTMTSLDVMSTPLSAILEYIHTTVGTAHYALGKGYTAADIASHLIEPLMNQGEDHLRLDTEISTMRKSGDHVELVIGEETILVDKVIIATQATTALALLGTLQPSLEGEERAQVQKMREALTEVDYRETIVVTHRDHSVLPQARDTRTINLTLPMIDDKLPIRLSRSELETEAPATITDHPSPAYSDPLLPTKAAHTATPYFQPLPGLIYTMGTHVIPPPKRLRDQGGGVVLQTTNPVMPIDSNSVLAVAKLERALPLRNPSTLIRLRAPQDVQSSVYLAGSYAYPGIPLLEGCVGGAKYAVEDILRSTKGSTVRSKKHRLGGIDWNAGQGSWASRLWRYRWR